MKKFFKAYFETYYGNYDACYDWMRYLVCVYIKNNGNVEKFDEQRSKVKFNELLSDPNGNKKLFATKGLEYEIAWRNKKLNSLTTECVDADAKHFAKTLW